MLPKHFERCTSLFSVIPINPYGEVMACCGLISEKTPYLRIGNINETSIKEIYEQSFKDLLKVLLFVDGPAKILKKIASLKHEKLDLFREHICDACRTLFNDYSNIEFLIDNYDCIATNAILDYQLLTSKIK